MRKQPSPLTPKGDQYYVISLKDINKLSKIVIKMKKINQLSHDIMLIVVLMMKC